MTEPDELSRLFRAERHERPPDGSRQRAWTRVAAALASGATPLSLGAAPLALGLFGTAKWVLLGAGLGAGLVTSAVLLRPAVHPPERGASQRTSAVVVSLTPPATASEVEPPPPEPPPEPPPKPSVRAPGPTATAAPIPSSSASTLNEELRLIENAKRELDGGRPHLAEAWLSEHAARFPDGTLRFERDALRVLAKCASGSGQGRAQAERYARENPRSPLLDRMARACGLGRDGAPDGARPGDPGRKTK